MARTQTSRNYGKLRSLLERLFRMDQAELDFGIYRVMNQKRDEISRFLDNDLLPQVEEAFRHYEAADSTEIANELEKTIRQAEALGADPDTLPRVQQLRDQLNQSVDILALEEQVFSHLANFFARYYDNGDFMSLRRYKEGVYAIPYEGEEVKLHWANADQYYIKTAEYFTNYTFRLPDGRRVHFELVAASTEQNNNKELNGKDRRFVLSDEEPLVEKSDQLFIRFEYRPREGRQSQDKLNAESISKVFAAEGFDDWLGALRNPAPTERNPNRTLLEKHLAEYTARNTFDYFIHKDLGGFLRRELDFYIKNEVMHLDDIENESAPKVEQYLSLIKVLRSIAHKIIAFLEQLENFQKKLWLKKKFVIETQYCITLDRVPEELYPEIAANNAQREDWVDLFAIDEIEGDLTTPGYSVPLTVDFLKANQNLVLDTCHFPETFKRKLLASIDDLDEQCDGLLIHSENFHALNKMQKRYRKSVQTMFIDPPYNTERDRAEGRFLYKDGYEYSTWLSMIADRLRLSRSLLKETGGIFVSLDDTMYVDFSAVAGSIFGRTNHVGTIIWEKVHTRKNSARYFSVSHDYIPCYAFAKETWDRVLIPRETTDAYSNPDDDPRGPWKADPIYANNPYDADYTILKPSGIELAPPPGQYWRFSEETWRKHVEQGSVIWGKEDSYPMVKRYLSDVQDGLVPVTLFDRVFAGDNMYANREFDGLFGSMRLFPYPKPTRLIERVVQTNVRPASNATILDFFAGSGTTGHAVVNLNRLDGGQRKFILVEMGSYFDTVLKPRIAKVVYSTEWNDGKPVNRDTGISYCVKYVRLESYEDTLNNLELRRTKAQASLLTSNAEFREEYMLSYMLHFETQGSQSLLNIEGFAKPDEYALKIERDGETRTVNVDLVETFNWLLGLSVKTVDSIDGVQVVDGINPEGERVLVLWRDIEQTDNDALDDWFHRQQYSTRDLEYDIIYVNGDNNLENWRREDQTWKVRLIEEDFHRLMFETRDV